MTALRDPGSEITFYVDFTDHGDALALHGELDISTAPTLDAVFDLVAAEPGELVLDLSDLDFIDSVGLTRLVKIHQRITARGGKLALRHPRANVRRVFAVSGLDHVIGIEDPP